jgi:hypothetical protein
MGRGAASSVCSGPPQLVGVLALVAAGLVPLAASAGPVTQASGLDPGDPYRLAFVTSTTRDATSSNLADYNLFVTNLANSVPQLAALDTTWTAIASTNTVDARDNTSTNPLNDTGVPIYLLDGTALANDNGDLWDGSIINPLRVSESGINLGCQLTWTGSSTVGQRQPIGFLGYSDVFVGSSCSSTNPWMVVTLLPSSLDYHLYGISGVLTAIPEPATSAQLLLGLIAMGVLRRRS